MTIPEKPLEISFDFMSLTLDEVGLFDPEQIEAMKANPASGFSYLAHLRLFLLRHITSWTSAEIGGLTVVDMNEVVPKMVEAIQATAVPLANSTPSKVGRAKKRT